MSKGSTETIVILGVVAAAGLYLWGRTSNNAEAVEIRQDAKTDRVEIRQDAKTDRVEIRNNTFNNTVDKAVSSIKNISDSIKKTKSAGGNYVTTFSPKKAQEVAVKLATPNKLTYTPSGKPNYALSASINKVITQATPVTNTKNKLVSFNTVSTAKNSTPVKNIVKGTVSKIKNSFNKLKRK